MKLNGNWQKGDHGGFELACVNPGVCVADTRDGRGPTDATYWRLATFGVFEAKRTSSLSCLASLFACLLFLLSLLVFSLLALRCLPPFLSFLFCLSSPPASFSLFSLSRSFFPGSLFASLSPLSFLLSYSLRTGCCHNNKGKSPRTDKQTQKITDNSGWVWLTGVNLASLKMGLNVAFLFTGPFQGVVNVPAGRSVGLRVYARTPAGILELES